MKKICIMSLLFILLYSYKMENVKTIEVEDVGTLRIPKEWVYNKDGDFIYFTKQTTAGVSKDFNPLMIGIVFDEFPDVDKLSEFYGKNISAKELIGSRIYSNSAIVGRAYCLIDDTICEKFFIRFWSSDRKLFLMTIDESVDYDLMKEIAKSYKR